MNEPLSWYDCAAAELGGEWHGRLVARDIDDWGIEGLTEEESFAFLTALAELHPTKPNETQPD